MSFISKKPKKSRVRWIQWWGVLGVCSGLASGCQLVGSARQEGVMDQTAPVFRIFPAGDDADLPDPGLALDSERVRDQVLTAQDEWVFTQNIAMDHSSSAGLSHEGGPRPLFLVWGEGAYGSTVRGAFIDHRLMDKENQEVGKVRRFPALFDVHSRRWYLPLSEVLRADHAGEDPSWQHLFVVDLELANGERKLLKLRFRCIGPLAGLPIEEISGPTSLGGLGSARAGWGIRTFRITNPHRRDFRVWLRDRSDSSWRLRTLLTQQQVVDRPNDPPTLTRDVVFFSDAVFVLGRVQVRSPQGGSETRSMASQQWISELIPAGESREFSFEAVATHESPLCAIPAPGGRNYHWSRTYYHRGDDHISNRDQWVVEPWVLRAQRLEGHWHPEIQVSHPWDQKPETALLLWDSIKTEFAEIGDRIADIHAPLGCQGVF